MKEERRANSIASMAERHTRRQTWGDRDGRGGESQPKAVAGECERGGGEACSQGGNKGLSNRSLPKGVEGAGGGSDGRAT